MADATQRAGRARFAPFPPAASRVAAIYAVVAVAWILVSDRVALALIGETAELSSVQTVKGLAFVLASAGLIHLLVRRERHRWHLAEARERRLARQFEAIFRTSPAGILITDIEEDRHVAANERLLELLRFRRDDVVGRSRRDLPLWSSRGTDDAFPPKLNAQRSIRDAMALFQDGDGDLHWMQWSAVRTRLDDRDHVVAVLTDLTDRAEAYEQTLAGWAQALDLRDHETGGHALRVTELAVSLGERLDMDPESLVQLRWGALLHDVGKIGVPDAILHKPGPLDEDEWVVMKKHPAVGRRLLEGITFLAGAIDVPAHHHERWDGSGYPDGLAGTAIPYAARIFAVVDVWDALTSDRPYRHAWSRQDATDHIRAQAGTHFDPEVTAAFVAMVERDEV